MKQENKLSDLPQKAEIYNRYPLSSIFIYNGTTTLHYILGAGGIILGYNFFPHAGYMICIPYLLFSFSTMYVLMPLRVCPNCPYYKMKDSRCISGMNIFSRKIASEGSTKNFPNRAKGVFCDNNLYMASLIFPIIFMLPMLFINFSIPLLGIFLALISLLIYRVFIIFPKIACLHCAAKFKCPQAETMGVRDL
ncbi:hypothetical protein ACFL7D_06315 [candidate division KSB1 bacterium]